MAVSVSELMACDIAKGASELPEASTPFQVVVKSKDYNTKGRRRHHWYRMAFRGGQWQYIGGALPAGNFRAADRRCDISTEVYLGDILAQHDHGGPVTGVLLVTGPDAEGEPHQVLTGCQFIRTSSGKLRITLPDQSILELPDPRRR